MSVADLEWRVPTPDIATFKKRQQQHVTALVAALPRFWETATPNVLARVRHLFRDTRQRGI